MIVVDTNVLSEPLSARPSAAVLRWLDAHQSDLAITTITIGELVYGVARLPPGRRREGLRTAIDRLVRSAGPRLLPYDEAAARAYAVLRVARESAGRPVAVEDLMIAAIAMSRRVTVATRNVADFDGCGVDLVNPWDEGT